MPSYNIPEVLQESSMAEPAPAVARATEGPVTYQKVDTGTKRGCHKLVDSLGYTYNVKSRGKTPYTLTWQCTVRSKKMMCLATVREKGGSFTAGPQPHRHAPEKGALVKTQVSVTVKRSAEKNLFTSAGSLVQKVLTTHQATSFLPEIN